MNPYSGTSTLAKVLRFSAVGVGLVYGSIKMSYYKASRLLHSAAAPHHARGTGLPRPLGVLLISSSLAALALLQSQAAKAAKKAHH
ncbi:hypothetical protein CHLNCDRAFT_141223 [Chlorella variabilis]|uniref:ATP synthase subunit e, mitochondrial n=1 Tax=Chlorella variabilis TaxID=554065 RepID=E1ZSD1_CHLVA|nr:hypothetical protein CHLNCDRAFT_141223 [Chlorella variabilis]EFN51225.1 hypothetical protein CHLNCDRAFT_141223 [Chlorella variabilis]|eukprot:XP_005843327.1 hypothetical protein CHLNCDRAFT_141223 [Chlorella variabilis]